MNLTTQQTYIVNKLQDFDTYMEKLLKDWNVPGVGVGIVAEDKLVFAQGYGDRNYQEKLPFTPKILFPIASTLSCLPLSLRECW
ncbi:MAG: serine hydrolase [Pleurocapsa sp. MO_192.B19]|nr:serine hydrolase [Pleurocapsa sp. MO_192.B19]